jgi:hypothetical protein
MRPASVPGADSPLSVKGAGQKVTLGTGIKITGATRSWGGAVYLSDGATLVLDGAEISSNTAANTGTDPNFAYQGGAGILIEGSGTTAIMKSGVIQNNTATPLNGGGGVYICPDGVFIMSGGTIEGNVAERGGGVYVREDSSFIMKAGSIINNTGGGGVYVEPGGSYTRTAATTTISGNTGGDEDIH